MSSSPRPAASRSGNLPAASDFRRRRAVFRPRDETACCPTQFFNGIGAVTNSRSATLPRFLCLFPSANGHPSEMVVLEAHASAAAGCEADQAGR